MKNNEEYDAKAIAAFREVLGTKPYLEVDTEENSDEFVQFQFIGMLDGREVIFDTAMYTLRLHHESELYEVAEQRAKKQFPNYKKIDWGDDEDTDDVASSEKDMPPDPLEEEIGWFMAEVILELEEEESVKVKEHVDMVPDAGERASLDVGLNEEKITPKGIEKFIREFNTDSLKLDETLYSFQSEGEDT